MTCGETMICYDEVNDETLRLDLFKCTKCESWAEVTYNKKGFKEQIKWKRSNNIGLSK